MALSPFDRCHKLFDHFEKIQNLRILICGVGGVGGYALECLYKSGVTDITVIDYDTFEITNQNRQIGSDALGEKKVDVLAKRYKGIKTIDQKLDPAFIDSFDFSSFDYIIDAIDDFEAKISLLKKSYDKVFSSMGAAKRLDPTQIEIASIWNTTNDPFAKKIRQRLKKEHFIKKIRVVYSKEKPKACEMGSFIGVTAAFGLALCSALLQETENNQIL